MADPSKIFIQPVSKNKINLSALEERLLKGPTLGALKSKSRIFGNNFPLPAVPAFLAAASLQNSRKKSAQALQSWVLPYALAYPPRPRGPRICSAFAANVNQQKGSI